MSGREMAFIKEAFESNYIAPVGPQVDALEAEFADEVGVRYAVAVSSGTAALHLSLRYAGVQKGDEVFCSTFTFIASASPILYLGATPVFVDSDRQTWNMDSELLAEALKKRSAVNRLPKAVVLVHLYGQAADIDPIRESCNQYGVTLIEDAAEALGAKYKGQMPGTFSMAGIFSFNGNKIITGSSGGMIVSDDQDLIEKTKFWATQARDEAAHYEHTEMGYNYRMSNVVAAICRGQLQVLDDRVSRKREIFLEYRNLLSSEPGIHFMPVAAYGKSNHWLTCITVNKDEFGGDAEAIRIALEENNIESRPLWMPMHMQPIFKDAEVFGGSVSEELFASGLCLPSGTALTTKDIRRIVDIVKSCRLV
jgi:pyridoxal phosphate-dependent aminotransferase EpsN